MKNIKYLIIIILILLPFGELLRFDFGSNIILKPIDIMIGITAVYWLILKIIVEKKIKIPQWYFLAFPFIGFASLLANSYWIKSHELLVSSMYLLRWISYFMIFFIIRTEDSAFKKTITKILIVDGFLILSVGFIQYYFFNSLRPLYGLGWDDHMNRMFSVFFDPNYTGAFLVLYLILLSGIFFSKFKFINFKKYYLIKIKAASFKRAFKKLVQLIFINQKKEKNQKLILAVILIFNLIGIYLTFSRSALFMFVIFLSIYLYLKKLKKLLIIIYILIALYMTYLFITTPFYANENMNLIRHNSSNARLSNTSTGLMIVSDHPLIGVGFNSYRYTKELYGLNHDWVDSPSHADAGVDNSFIFILATTGIFGFISYLALWIHIIKNAWLNYRQNCSVKPLILILSVISLFADALFINSLFYAPIMLWIWIIAGLSYE